MSALLWITAITVVSGGYYFYQSSSPSEQTPPLERSNSNLDQQITTIMPHVIDQMAQAKNIIIKKLHTFDTLTSPIERFLSDKIKTILKNALQELQNALESKATISIKPIQTTQKKKSDNILIKEITSDVIDLIKELIKIEKIATACLTSTSKKKRLKAISETIQEIQSLQSYIDKLNTKKIEILHQIETRKNKAPFLQKIKFTLIRKIVSNAMGDLDQIAKIANNALQETEGLRQETPVSKLKKKYARFFKVFKKNVKN